MDYRELIGPALENPGDFRACYAFSIHKAGSSLLHGMIQDACLGAKIPALNVPDTLFHWGVFEPDWHQDPSVKHVFGRGFVYYGFRSFPPLLWETDGFQDAKCCLLVRDPRDALVSQFFSFGPGGSHASPKFAPDARPSHDTGSDIDRYVLEYAENYQYKLREYAGVMDACDTLVIRYEDLFEDKLTYLQAVFDHFGLSVPNGVIETVAKRHDIRPTTEDPTKHIRKGSPGDHKEKLSSETIAALNDIFAVELERYGFACSAP